MSKPLSDIRMRDPFVLEVPAGGFVMFGTTDENLGGGPATGFDCCTSDDLATWEGPTLAFRPPVGFWADTQFWAPEVVAHDGRSFMMVPRRGRARTRCSATARTSSARDTALC